MKKILSILCSIPVILVALYFIPFLGIVLILFRLYYKSHEKMYILPLYMIFVAIIIFIPKAIYMMINALAIKIEIPYLDKIIAADFYNKLIGYGRFLVIIGVLYIILYYVFTNAFIKIKSSLNSKFNNYIEKNEQRAYEIQKQNDLIMKEKQDKAKNTHFVSCPTCGSDNILYGNIGTCKHCRRTITYKEKENKKSFDVEK